MVTILIESEVEPLLNNPECCSVRCTYRSTRPTGELRVHEAICRLRPKEPADPKDPKGSGDPTVLLDAAGKAVTSGLVLAMRTSACRKGEALAIAAQSGVVGSEDETCS